MLPTWLRDAVAVIDTQKLTAKISRKGMVEPDGFVPTEWMPMSMAFLPFGSSAANVCFVATAKGKGTGQILIHLRSRFPRDGMPKKTQLYRNSAVWFPGGD